MPLYEYYCQACGESFERLISASRADNPQICPSCASEQTSRQLSSFAVAGGSGTGRMMAPPVSSPFT